MPHQLSLLLLVLQYQVQILDLSLNVAVLLVVKCHLVNADDKVLCALPSLYPLIFSFTISLVDLL